MAQIGIDVTGCDLPEVRPDGDGCYAVSFKALPGLAPVDAKVVRLTTEQLAALVRLARKP